MRKALIITAMLIFSVSTYTTSTEADAQKGDEGDYHTYEELTQELQGIAENYPEITELYSLGKTWEDRDIWAMKISDNAEIDEDEPEVLIVGAHHAREWISVEVPLYYLKFLVENYGKEKVDNDGDGRIDEDTIDGIDNDGDGIIDEDEIDARITWLVNNREIWIIPMLNPDGVAYSMERGDLDRPDWDKWRKNKRDNDDDGEFEDDYDGVDLNRNYDFLWGVDVDDGTSDTSHNPPDSTYCGPYDIADDDEDFNPEPYPVGDDKNGNGEPDIDWDGEGSDDNGDGDYSYDPEPHVNEDVVDNEDNDDDGLIDEDKPGGFSEPETQAIRDLVNARDFVISFSYHSYVSDGAILWPWGYTDEPSPDHSLFLSIAENISSMNDYTVFHHIWYHTAGDADDWLYGVHGILAFTLEIKCDEFIPPEEDIPDLCKENLGPNLYMTEIADNPQRNSPLIAHELLKNTSKVGPYKVSAQITSEIGLDLNEIKLYYKINEGNFYSVSMSSTGDDEFSAEIPSVNENSTIYYYIEAKDIAGHYALFPKYSPENAHSFTFAGDTEKPEIKHDQIEDISYCRGFNISAKVTDEELNYSSVLLYYWDKGAEPEAVQMQNIAENRFFAHLGNVDALSYYFEAKDESGNVAREPENGSYSIALIFNDEMEKGENNWSVTGEQSETTIFFDDFENGLDQWEIDTNDDGGVVIASDTEAFNGEHCAKFFGDGTPPNNITISKTLNLRGYTNVTLRYYWAQEDLEDESHAFVDIYDGEWHLKVREYGNDDNEHDTTPEDYTVEEIMLDEYNLTDNFIIRFRSHAKDPEEFDTFLLDDVEVVVKSNGDWHQVSTNYKSDETSWWNGDSKTGRYRNLADDCLITPPINITGMESCILVFWHDYNFEYARDGGIIEVSDDNETWEKVSPIDGYDDTLLTGSGNALEGEEAFTGDSNGWREERVNLVDYTGEILNLRFHFGSDNSWTTEGWYIDDVVFYGKSAFIRSINLSIEEDRKEIVFGDSTTYSFEVKNEGSIEDTVYLTVIGLPDGWDAWFDDNGIILESGESRIVTLTLNTPSEEDVGEYTIYVKGESAYDSSVYDTVKTVTTLLYPIEISIKSNHKWAEPGSDVEFSFTVRNNREVMNEIELSIELPENWTEVFGSDVLYIMPKGEQSTTLILSIYSKAIADDYDSTLKAEDEFGFASNSSIKVTVNKVYGFSASGDGNFTINPSSTESLIVKLESLANTQDTFELSISADEGWNAVIENESLTLNPFEKVSIYLNITSPYGTVGSYGKVYLNITSSESGKKELLIFNLTLSQVYELSFYTNNTEKELKPGESVVYIFGLRNLGNGADEFSISKSIAPTGWEASLDKDSVLLEPNKQENIVLSVTAPENALKGETAEITVTARSKSASVSESVLTVTRVKHVYTVSLSADVNQKSADAGSSVVFSLTVINTGNALDEFSLSVDEFPDTWDYQFDKSMFSLDAYSSDDRELTVKIPKGYYAGNYTFKTLCTSENGAYDEIFITVIVRGTHDFTINAEIKESSTSLNAPLVYKFKLINHGTSHESIALSVSPKIENVTYKLSKEVVELEPEGEEEITLTLIVLSLPGSNYLETTVTASSSGVEKTIIFTTTLLKPDLEVAKISFSKEKPKANEIIEISATIKNIGFMKVSCIVRFFDGENEIGNGTIDDLKENEIKIITIEWKAEKGSHKISVKVFPVDIIDEYSTENNELSRTIKVEKDKGEGFLAGFEFLSVLIMIFIIVMRKLRKR